MEHQAGGLDIADIYSALRRRWWLLLAPIAPAVALATMIAMVLPPSYSATARILVESQRIPEELARSTVTAGAVERVRLIEQRLMTRQNLLDIAQRFNVFGDRPGMSPTDIVDAMRSQTSIDNVVLATEGRGEVTASAIHISFRSDNPTTTARVANEFVSLVLEQNIQQRTARAAGTLDFFNGEVQRLSGELASIERQIVEYKKANESALPESLEFRRNELSAIQQRQFERQGQRIALEEQKRLLQRSISLGRESEIAGAAASPEAAELDRLRASLTQQRAVYAESHPVIRSLNARIEVLEAAVAAEKKPEDGGAPVESEAERQIRLIDDRLALLTEQAEAESKREDALAESIERTPAVEAQLATLERTLDNLKVQHQQAVLKQAEAAIGERLEVNSQAERFEVIEQAATPTSPDSPNRVLIVAMGLAGGIGLGGGLTFLVELLTRRIRAPRHLERQLDMRPIVTIPYIWTERELRLRRLTLYGAALAVFVVVPVTLYLVDRFYEPLPVLADRMYEKSGLSRAMELVEARFGR